MFKIITERHNYNRILWILTYMILLGCSTYYIFGVYVKWQFDPDISINIKTASGHKIPFPAITICPPYVIPDEHVNFTNFLLKIKGNDSLPEYSNDEQQLLIAMMEVCPQDIDYSLMENKGRRLDTSIYHLINLTISSKDIIEKFCALESYVHACEKMFNIVPTDKGLCYSFNMQGYNTIFNKEVLSDDFNFYRRRKIVKSLNPQSMMYNNPVNDDNETVHWTLQNGYSSKRIDLIPYRASKSFLRIILGFRNLNFVKCFGNSFHVILHLPNEMPNPYSVSAYANLSKATNINFMISTVRRAKSMENYLPEIRQCYFDGEKLLKFFKSYTKAHCDFECLTNYTLKTCGCIRFYMPRSTETRVCDLIDLSCTTNALNDYEKRSEYFKLCKCLSPCNEIKYTIEETISQDNLDGSPAFIISRDHNLKAVSTIDISVLNLEIEEHEYFTSYSLQNFIADVGGLLGIFLGFSFLSLIEFIQKCVEYFTMNRRRRIESTRHPEVDTDQNSPV